MAPVGSRRQVVDGADDSEESAALMICERGPRVSTERAARRAPSHESANTCQATGARPIVEGPSGPNPENSANRSVIQTSIALLGLNVVALVSLTGLIGAREGQPA
jgi:hypothetical protein